MSTEVLNQKRQLIEWVFCKDPVMDYATVAIIFIFSISLLYVQLNDCWKERPKEIRSNKKLLSCGLGVENMFTKLMLECK